MAIKQFAVCIFLDRKGKTAVQERKDSSPKNEVYALWGGRLEKDETPDQAIRRELLEELTLEPKKLQHIFDHEYSSPNGKEKIYYSVFISPLDPVVKKSQVREGKGMIIIPLNEAIFSNFFWKADRQILDRVRSGFNSYIRDIGFIPEY
jgi:8-oxo-dGTP pyrophosphatase MutT (NUDIX family)